MSKVICPECQAEAYAAEMNCPACGALLPRPCARCGRPTRPRERLCPDCQAAAHAPPRPPSPLEGLRADAAFVCPACRQPILITQALAVCPACRTRQHHACWAQRQGCAVPGCAAYADGPARGPAEKCHQCGESVRPGASVCLYCGAATRRGPLRTTFAFTAAEAVIALGSLLALLALLLPWHHHTEAALALEMFAAYAVLAGLSGVLLGLSLLAPRLRLVLARGHLGLAVLLLLTVTWAWARIDAETARVLVERALEQERPTLATWPRLAPAAGLWLALAGALLLAWGGSRRAHLTRSRALPAATAGACLALVLLSAVVPRRVFPDGVEAPLAVQPLFGFGRVPKAPAEALVSSAVPSPTEALDGDTLLRQSQACTLPPEIAASLQDYLRQPSQSGVELIGTAHGPSRERPYRAFGFNALGFLEVYDYHAIPQVWKRNQDLSGAETSRSRALTHTLRDRMRDARQHLPAPSQRLDATTGASVHNQTNRTLWLLIDENWRQAIPPGGEEGYSVPSGYHTVRIVFEDPAALPLSRSLHFRQGTRYHWSITQVPYPAPGEEQADGPR